MAKAVRAKARKPATKSAAKKAPAKAAVKSKVLAKRPPGRPKGSTRPPKVSPGTAIDKDWFVGRLKDVGKSMRALARFLEVEASTVSLMFSGRRKMRLDEAEAIARFLDVTVETVLRHAGIRSLTSEESGEARLVPVTGRIDGRGRVVLKKRFTTPDGAAGGTGGVETVTGPAGLPAGAVALVGRFQGKAADQANSQAGGELALLDNAYFFYVPSKKFSPGAVGRLSIVQVGGRTVLRRVIQSDDPDQFELTGFGAPSPAAELDAATPILWIRA